MSAFTPRTAVITGGASGIGFAIARELAGQGITVMLADLPGDRLDRAAGMIEGALTQPCDVGDLAQVEALAEAAFERLGEVHLVLNNAGVGGPNGRLWEVGPEAARAHFDVNFWGVWHGCRAFAPRLIEQAAPSAIYNTGSENSLFCAVPRSAAYIAAKHAVLGLTESLREDLPSHVHAGTIIPGWVFTDIGPEQFMKPGMPAEDYARIVVPQLLARRRFVVSHGYNTVRIAERMDELAASYAEYALPPDEDAKHDVRLVMDALRQAQE
ncbi:SDR family NAD(P)-dependent oxidoreductase [Altererythrobacter sp. BO-6]|uniref:SDR family NAD(P)-dependent oxidoreductase n=1 Tax=Altererythrobacter sp. BO-6 TaxID=2604537 RepID=UPI0013E16153|nr:SDR family NAD(P)-dependent oxidoreductase [Altererythrobacter sp. BO-6]QIG55043.1 SDR family NAD(P)-dependent oxidoreductase [Altererythrobacter sp. BO-6]